MVNARTNRAGFTLIELLVVLVVILLLTTLAFAVLNSSLPAREGAADRLGSGLSAARATAILRATYVAVDFSETNDVSFRVYNPSKRDRVAPFGEPEDLPPGSASPPVSAEEDDSDYLDAHWETIDGLASFRLPSQVVLLHGSQPWDNAAEGPTAFPNLRTRFSVVFGPDGGLRYLTIRRPVADGRQGYKVRSPASIRILNRSEAANILDADAARRLTPVYISPYSGSIIRDAFHDPEMSWYPLPG